jgi:uncharacterized protein YndB with AHSA1/START domain
MQKTQAPDIKERVLIITRIFDAPKELLWKAWTQPEAIKLWWGPKAFTAPVFKIDLRVGGETFSCMRSPEGKDFCGKGIYREVVPPERLVMTDSFADEQGNIVSASYYGMSPDFPRELLITVTFEDHDGKTKMTLKHSGIRGISDVDYSGMKQGWEESFDKLAEYLAAENK